MVEPKSSNEVKRKLSIITDIMLLIPIIIGTIALIKSVDIPVFDKSSTEVLSLEVGQNNIQDENEEYIEKIKKEFGINVMYGKNAAPFASKLDAVSQFDENIINNNLRIIYNSLQKYPVGIFEMSISKENPIYIMIVDYFENNNIALASRNNLNEYRIYISNTEKLERAFHHEMYHVLEYYMTQYKTNLYNDWNLLNPENFTYNIDTSKLDKEYVYTKEEDLSSEEEISLNNEYYFVTRYSKSSEKEDRAEIFAELMIMNYPPSYLSKGQKIRKKVECIFDTIRENITVEEFYCTKFLI